MTGRQLQLAMARPEQNALARFASLYDRQYDMVADEFPDPTHETGMVQLNNTRLTDT
jgi:hypothetical protein